MCSLFLSLDLIFKFISNNVIVFSQNTDNIDPCCSSHLITGRRAARLMNSLFDLTMQIHFDVISSIDTEMLSPLV